MKHLKSIKHLLILTCLFFILNFGMLIADSYPPTAVFGVYGSETTYAEKGSIAQTLGGIETSGLLGWRTPAFNGGYFSINSNVDLNYLFLGIEVFEDFENISVNIALPHKKNKIKINVGADSSFSGIGIYPKYFRPYWEAGYYFVKGRKMLQPFFKYKGYYYNQPNYDEDSIYNGGEIGIKYKTSIHREYKLSLGGGVENFFEYPIYDSNGNPTGEKRLDYTTDVNFELSGLLGYFSDYRIGIGASLLLSNANRYLSTQDYLDTHSESKITLSMESEIGWSPNKRINIQVSPYIVYDSYISRTVLDSEGNPIAGSLRIFTGGTSFRVDYTLNNNLFFVVKGEGANKWSNDIQESGWSVNISGGVEYAF